jgi:hypothetical protein
MSLDPNWVCPACGQGGPLLSGTTASGEVVFCGECETIWPSIAASNDIDSALSLNAQDAELKHQGKPI